MRGAKPDTQDMGTTTSHQFEGIVTIKGSGLRGAKRAAAKAHNARLRIALRPRDAQGRFLPTGGERITSAVAAEASAFETFVASLSGTVPAGMVHVDELAFTGTITDAEGTTHGHANCAAIIGATVAGEGGWLCAMCIHVPTPISILARDIAPTIGTKACTCCGNVRKMTAFPTILIGGDDGFRDRGDECRACQRARREEQRELSAAA